MHKTVAEATDNRKEDNLDFKTLFATSVILPCPARFLPCAAFNHFGLQQLAALGWKISPDECMSPRALWTPLVQVGGRCAQAIVSV